MKKLIARCVFSLLLLVIYGSVINVIICSSAERHPTHSFLVIVISIAIEELLFRFFPYIIWEKFFTNSVSFWILAIVSSAVFAFIHRSLLQVLMLGPVGIVLMYLMRHLSDQTRAIYATMILVVIHLCYNYAIWSIF